MFENPYFLPKRNTEFPFSEIPVPQLTPSLLPHTRDTTLLFYCDRNRTVVVRHSSLSFALTPSPIDSHTCTHITPKFPDNSKKLGVQGHLQYFRCVEFTMKSFPDKVGSKSKFQSSVSQVMERASGFAFLLITSDDAWQVHFLSKFQKIEAFPGYKKWAKFW